MRSIAVMTDATTTTTRPRAARGGLLNKVPEVTIWFWIIKILCTTVGESFADYINETLGFGLTNTMLLFTAIFVVVLTWQFRTRRYTPFPYWLTVVVVSVAGTLYTDELTNAKHVPLWLSSTVFAVLLASVFGAWWLRERSLSIHSINTYPREAFYWLTVLVTFALGTATGDWTLQLTNWAPAQSVFLPLGLIVAVTVLWRLGANPVLSFWLAYILTRPLGANIGDWLASPRAAQNAGDPVGLGLGTLVTSLIFLGAILATVVYLTVSRTDVIETYEATHEPTGATKPARERIGLAGFGALAVTTVAIMAWAHHQPHLTCDPSGASETLPACPKPAFSAAQASAAASGLQAMARHAIVQDEAGDTAGSHATVQRMRDTWDAEQPSLDTTSRDRAWQVIDKQMDNVLEAYGIDHANKPYPVAQQEQRLTTLLGTFGANPL